MAVPAVTTWYAKLAGGVSGPFSLEELQYLVSRSRLGSSDLLQRSGTQDWTPARELEILFPSTHPSAPHTVESPTLIPPPLPICAAAAEPSHAAPPDLPILPRAPRFPTPALPPGQRVRPTSRNALLIGASIGVAAALLLLLLLLLLLHASGPGIGQGTGQGGGAGDGVGSGTGGGAGPGVGPSHDEQSDPSPAGVTVGSADTAEEARQPSNPTSPLAPPAEISPRRSLFEIRSTDSAESRTAADDDRFSGAGRGSGGGGGGGGRSDGSEFFGVKARGKSFAYVVDCSGSMTGVLFSKACRELLDSIRRMTPQQSFYVIFFDQQPFPMFHPDSAEPRLLNATRDNMGRLESWVNAFAGGGGTDPTEAMRQALALTPDGIFLLTDGMFPPTAVEVIRSENKRKIIINTIGFVNPAGEPLLRQIAQENRGKYRFIP